MESLTLGVTPDQKPLRATRRTEVHTGCRGERSSTIVGGRARALSPATGRGVRVFRFSVIIGLLRYIVREPETTVRSEISDGERLRVAATGWWDEGR